MAPTEAVRLRQGPAPAESQLVRVYVWEAPVRIAHWVVFLSVVVLSATGYYLYRPFLIARGDGAWVMGTMRFVHEVAGVALICALVLRLYWFFVGNRWTRFGRFVPISPARRRGMVEVLKYYLFLRWRMPRYLDHNPLAGLAYVGVYLVLLIEVLTGLALMQWVVHSDALGVVIGWLLAWFDVWTLRQVHFLLMFLLWVFVIHHVYSALVVDREERMGLMGSIFSGYKFAPRSLIERGQAPSVAPEEGAAAPADRPTERPR